MVQDMENLFSIHISLYFIVRVISIASSFFLFLNSQQQLGINNKSQFFDIYKRELSKRNLVISLSIDYFVYNKNCYNINTTSIQLKLEPNVQIYLIFTLGKRLLPQHTVDAPCTARVRLCTETS